MEKVYVAVWEGFGYSDSPSWEIVGVYPTYAQAQAAAEAVFPDMRFIWHPTTTIYSSKEEQGKGWIRLSVQEHDLAEALADVRESERRQDAGLEEVPL